MKLMFGFWFNFSTIYWAASIFLMATRPGPYLLIASDTIYAACESPSALIIVALFSSSFIWTMNLALSASYWATCFCSMDWENSCENCKWVKATSSRMRPKSLALLYNCSLMSCETFSLIVINCPASYWATIDFKTSFPMEGIILSS